MDVNGFWDPFFEFVQASHAFHLICVAVACRILLLKVRQTPGYECADNEVIVPADLAGPSELRRASGNADTLKIDLEGHVE